MTINSRANTSASTQPRTVLRRADGSSIRVLVVDDESTLTDLLSMALHYEDWEVKTASTGQQALTIAREFRPDVVVLDIMLP
ncbi:MAG TPA: response regulator, partial [Diaminobutyricibacter sp.]